MGFCFLLFLAMIRTPNNVLAIAGQVGQEECDQKGFIRLRFLELTSFRFGSHPKRFGIKAMLRTRTKWYHHEVIPPWNAWKFNGWLQYVAMSTYVPQYWRKKGVPSILSMIDSTEGYWWAPSNSSQVCFHWKWWATGAIGCIQHQ